MSEPTSGNAQGRMALQRFRVQGYRCLQDVRLTLEPDVTVLVGRNDVGKTALLDALYDYGQVGQQGLRYVSSDPELTGDAPTRFEAQWLDGATGELYDHELSCDEKHPAETLRWGSNACAWHPRTRKLSANGEEWDARRVGRSLYLAAIPLADWRTETDVPDEISEHLCQAARFVTPVPFLFQPHALASDTQLSVDRVLGSGYGWGRLLQQVVATRGPEIDRLEEYMRVLFPFFGRATVVEDAWELTRRVSGTGTDEPARDARRAPEPYLQEVVADSSRRRVEIEVVAPQSGLFESRWVGAHAVSSGLLLTLAYLTVAMSSPNGSLLALEEPENGLNRVITERMMELFLETIRERGHQLLMTTHNESWLDLVGPSRVRVVTRDEHGTHIQGDPENLQKILDEELYLSEVMALGGPEALLRPRGGA